MDLNVKFNIGDIIQFKNNANNENIEKKYKLHKIEKIKAGNWHDGYGELYFGYLEDLETQITEKKLIVYISAMNQIYDIFIAKCAFLQFCIFILVHYHQVFL